MDDKYYLEFEKPIIELDRKIKEIRDLAGSSGADLEEEILNLEKKRNRLQERRNLFVREKRSLRNMSYLSMRRSLRIFSHSVREERLIMTTSVC